MPQPNRTLVNRTLANRTFVDQSLSEFRIGFSACDHLWSDYPERLTYENYLFEITGPMGFDPHLVVHAGDHYSAQVPTELATHSDEGAEIARQRNSCPAMPVSKQIEVPGNHCWGDENLDCHNRFVDTFGNNTAFSGVVAGDRLYPVYGVEGSHVYFSHGNVTWFGLCDQNGGAQPWGRSGGVGGFPSGSYLQTALNALYAYVQANPNKNIIVFAHHLLKDTTIATGDNEGVTGGFHGTSGQPAASGRFENIVTNPATGAYIDEQTQVQEFMTANPGRISVWAGGHTHFLRNETYTGRGWNYFDGDTWHVSAGGLTLAHDGGNPESLAFIFTEGSTTLRINKFNNGGAYSVGLDRDRHIDVTLPFAYQS
jgi:hypothetical protein